MNKTKAQRNMPAGKGDLPRKLQITKEEYNKNWERIFGRKPSKPSSSGASRP